MPRRARAARPVAFVPRLRDALGRGCVPWLLAIAAAPVLAAGGDAVLLSITGDVRVIRTDRGWTAVQPLVRGDTLRAGDTVVTGDDGRAQMRFSDGALVTLQPRSRFKIDEYRFDAGSQRSFLSLLRGALRTTTGAIGKRSQADYRLRTPTATVGVRGTDYTAEETVCDPQCSPGAHPGLRVTVREGRVAVTSRAGTVEVPAGGSVHVGSPEELPRFGSARGVPPARDGLSAPRLPQAMPGASTPARPGATVPASPVPAAPVTPAPSTEPLPQRLPGTEARGPSQPGAPRAAATGSGPVTTARPLGRPAAASHPATGTAGTPVGQHERAEATRPGRAAGLGEDAAFPAR